MKNNTSIKHSLIVFISLLLLSCSQSSMTLFLEVSNAEGIQEDDPIQMKGMKIGSVENLSLHNNQVYIEISVTKDIAIPVDSYFSIENTDMLGNKHVTIIPGNKSVSYTENDTIRAVSLQNVIQKTIDSVESATEAFKEFSEQSK
ncbi:MAG: MCE family protein [Bacteroidales bacterium]